MEPSEKLDDVLIKLIKDIDEIDKETPWSEIEPDWWLDMMELRRFIKDKFDI